MSKDEKNRFRFKIDILVEWPKGLFRLVNAVIKSLADVIADLAEQIIIWIRNPGKWL
jgi:hypothetical protein